MDVNARGPQKTSRNADVSKLKAIRAVKGRVTNAKTVYTPCMTDIKSPTKTGAPMRVPRISNKVALQLQITYQIESPKSMQLSNQFHIMTVWPNITDCLKMPMCLPPFARVQHIIIYLSKVMVLELSRMQCARLS